jgi:hypothetical protein
MLSILVPAPYSASEIIFARAVNEQNLIKLPTQIHQSDLGELLRFVLFPEAALMFLNQRRYRFLCGLAHFGALDHQAVAPHQSQAQEEKL